jgi:Flp pilus assembly protein TadB
MQSKKEKLAAAEAELQAAQGQEQRFWSEVVPEMRGAADMERQHCTEAEAQVSVSANIVLQWCSAGTVGILIVTWVPLLTMFKCSI